MTHEEYPGPIAEFAEALRAGLPAIFHEGAGDE